MIHGISNGTSILTSLFNFLESCSLTLLFTMHIEIMERYSLKKGSYVAYDAHFDKFITSELPNQCPFNKALKHAEIR